MSLPRGEEQGLRLRSLTRCLRRKPNIAAVSLGKLMHPGGVLHAALYHFRHPVL